MTQNRFYSQDNIPQEDYFDERDYECAKESFFNRIGSRLNRNRYNSYDRYQRYDNRYTRRNYNQNNGHARYHRAAEQGYYQQDRYQQPPYTTQRTYIGRSEMRQISESVEQVVFNGAILSGVYHNLDDPKGDIRSFSHDSEMEVTGNENET